MEKIWFVIIYAYKKIKIDNLIFLIFHFFIIITFAK